MSIFGAKKPRRTMAEQELEKFIKLFEQGTPEQKASLAKRLVALMPIVYAQAQMSLDPWEEALLAQIKESGIKLFFRLRNPQSTAEELADAMLSTIGDPLRNLCIKALDDFRAEQALEKRKQSAIETSVTTTAALNPIAP